MWLDRQGGHETSVPLPEQRYTRAQVARDGRSVAVGIIGDDGNPNLWIGDLARGSFARLTAVETQSYRWSPDGRRIVYRKGDRTLWSQPADQSAPGEEVGR